MRYDPKGYARESEARSRMFGAWHIAFQSALRASVEERAATTDKERAFYARARKLNLRWYRELRRA